MIYGLYLSASGVVANAHRQDVIANNLANSETVGFKRDLTLFRTRLTEAQARRAAGMPFNASDPQLEPLGGGILASPTQVDSTQGDLEHTGSPLDVALQGEGFFRVQDSRDKAKVLLTRNGQFMVDRKGRLITADTGGHEVLDEVGKPIQVDAAAGAITIGTDGTVSQRNQIIGRLGVVAADQKLLTKEGNTLLSFRGPAGQLRSITPELRPEFVERANVDPTLELAALMDAQRQLEANANMIRYQDQTLQRLVNEVGKIG